MSKMDWVDEHEKEIEKEKAEGYLQIAEGDNRVQLLTHCAPLIQVWTGSTYRPAVEGDKNTSVKGLCYVLHDGKIKQASLAYTVVKAIRDLQDDPDYAFDEFPMPRMINIKAKNAGTKEVVYTVIPSPKETKVPEEILKELAEKKTPEEVVELKKGKVAPKPDVEAGEVDPEEIPF